MSYNTQKPLHFMLWLDVQCTCVGRIVLSTIPENDSILKGLLDVSPQKFKPSIPHLVRLLLTSCQIWIAYHACSMATFVVPDLMVNICWWQSHMAFESHFADYHADVSTFLYQLVAKSITVLTLYCKVFADWWCILQVYQYHIYTNYSSVLLSHPNPEIVADD